MFAKSKLRCAIAPCVGLFSFFGFADFIIPKNASSRKKCAASWVLAKHLMTLALMAFLFIDSMLGRIAALRDQNGVTLHLLVFIGIEVEGFAAVIQSLTSSCASNEFMRKMEQVDRILTKSLSLKIDYDDLRWKLLTNILSAVFFDFGCAFVVIFLVLSFSPQVWLFLTHFFVPTLISRIYLHRFMFYTQLLTSYLDSLIAIVEHAIATQPLLVRRDERKQWSLNTKRHHVRVKMLRKAYKLLWEASVLANQCYRVELVVGNLMRFVSLLYQGYSICVDIASKSVNHRHYIWMTNVALCLYQMHFHSQQCQKRVAFAELCDEKMKKFLNFRQDGWRF